MPIRIRVRFVVLELFALYLGPLIVHDRWLGPTPCGFALFHGCLLIMFIDIKFHAA